MIITEDNILEESKKGNLAVLDHPGVSTVKDKHSWTALHHLASRGVVEIMDHPSFVLVNDWTYRTPLHLLFFKKLITKEIIKKKYPWYSLKNDDVTQSDIDDIAATPRSVHFIKE